MELCLGTVQFGMKYGVNNAIHRQPTWEESFEMIDYALQKGITTIDTARAYGEAELVVGEYLKTHDVRNHIKIISKLRPNIINEGEKDIYGVICKEIENSFQRLGVDYLDGYLLHTPEYIYNHEIVNVLVKLKEKGYAKNIGVSIYNLKEGFAAIDTGVVDYVQLPYSILDQRGIKEGFIPKAKQAGLTIFTRSAFLQGLFMMSYECIPEHLHEAIPYLRKIDEISKKYGVDKVSAILNFVKCEADIDYLVFGVETIEQLRENIRCYYEKNMPQECLKELKEQFNNIKKSVIFPSLWSNGKKAE